MPDLGVIWPYVVAIGTVVSGIAGAIGWMVRTYLDRRKVKDDVDTKKMALWIEARKTELQHDRQSFDQLMQLQNTGGLSRERIESFLRLREYFENRQTEAQVLELSTQSEPPPSSRTIERQPDETVRIVRLAQRILNQLTIGESAIQAQLKAELFDNIQELSGIDDFEALLKADGVLTEDWHPWLHVYYHLLASRAEANTTWLKVRMLLKFTHASLVAIQEQPEKDLERAFSTFQDAYLGSNEEAANLISDLCRNPRNKRAFDSVLAYGTVVTNKFTATIKPSDGMEPEPSAPSPKTGKG